MTQSSVDRARQVVECALSAGVTDAVLAPGSRSGPLALALHAADQQRLLRLHVRVDEREAAFLALGMAKGSHRPTVVVTTSGTAVANLHPALLEAKHAGLPLIAVTADRPAALRGTGANQTTNQVEIFGSIDYLDDLDRLAPEAIASLRGPLHLNVEFDEPLIEPSGWSFAPTPVGAQSSGQAKKSITLDRSLRTVVIGGDDSHQPARHAAESAGWPLVAEPSSGSRTGDHALTAGRLLLTVESLAGQLEQVVSFGHATLSRPVTRLLSRTDLPIIHVGDPSTFPVPGGPNVQFVDAVDLTGDRPEGWFESWKAADERACAAIDGELDGSTALDVARTVYAALPPGGLLFLGSSSPIRDADLVARPHPVGERRYVMSNRGLAGIDGVLSSAIGATLVRQPTRALALVGDLTFLHGSNGLLIGQDEPRPDLTIVVVNDDGGSIFSILEQGAAEYADAFERVYATPTGADIAALCAGYRIPHRLVVPADLAEALAAAPTGIEVIEVVVDRTGRRALTDRISAVVRRQDSP